MNVNDINLFCEILLRIKNIMPEIASLVVKSDTSEVKNSNTDLQKMINVATGVTKSLSDLERSIVNASSSARTFDHAFMEGERITLALRNANEKIFR